MIDASLTVQFQIVWHVLQHLIVLLAVQASPSILIAVPVLLAQFQIVSFVPITTSVLSVSSATLLTLTLLSVNPLYALFPALSVLQTQPLAQHACPLLITLYLNLMVLATPVTLLIVSTVPSITLQCASAARLNSPSLTAVASPPAPKPNV